MLLSEFALISTCQEEMHYHFYGKSTRVKISASRDLKHMLEPLEMYAQIPRLLLGYALLEWATAQLGRVDTRLRCLAELKAATLTQCEYCIDLGSQAARLGGLSDEHLLALPNYRESDLFTDLEKLVLDYAVGMSRTPVDVPEPLFAKMRQHFNETQLVELTHVIAMENLRGRFNMALGIGAAGFSEGMVCAIPAPVTTAQPADRLEHPHEALDDRF